ncbi:alpha/beta-hydrolase [Ophiobolus disseminans]|uniref:Alpha/beta-hydrolase n=1 Tax=Ophiobolus disseminans TaxID=1469910 RepID=A0A6A7A228_9PLEO|nr:alpha/beta-hydrolase [Ophiobolus disseminans]
MSRRSAKALVQVTAVLYQFHSEEPLFQRCISMSGTPIMLKPLPLPVTEMVYETIMTELGLQDAPVDERIQRLRSIEPQELVEKTPMTVPLLPSLDDEIVPEATTFAKLANNDVPGWKWCEELMIGDCQHDGNVFLFMGLAQRKAGIAKALMTSLHNSLPTDAAAAVLDAYGIRSTTADDEGMDQSINLATDIAYVAPALAYARAFPGETYYYHFNEPNPWDGPFKGSSTHMLDATFLFQNFNEHMSDVAKEVAKSLAAAFIKFANGMKPWADFEETRSVRTYGPSDKSIVSVAENNGWGNGRRDALWKLGEAEKVDLDSLSAAWDMFIAGK